MNKNLHDIEDLFRSGLDDHEEMPSVKVWNAVDRRLDKDTVVTIKKKYQTLKKISLLLLLLLTGLAIYELNQYTSSGITKMNPDTGKATARDIDADKKNQTDKNSAISEKQIGSKDPNFTTPDKVPDNSAHSNITGKKDKQLNAVKQQKPPADTKFSINHLSISETSRHVVKVTTEQKTKPGKNVINLQNTNIKVPSESGDGPMQMKQPFTLLHSEKANTLFNVAAYRKRILQSIAEKDNLLTNAIAGAAQQARKKPVKPSRFSISGFFSPDIASYRLKDEAISNQPDNSQDIKRTERHEFSSTSGLLIEYAADKKWTIQSGITFSNTNIAVEPRVIYAQSASNGDIKFRLNISSGYAYLVPSFQPVPSPGDSLTVAAITHKLRYIGIPIAVKYNITNGKLKIQGMAGITTNFLTMGKLETEVHKGPNNEIDILDRIEALKSIYLSGQVGIGAEYKLAENVSFILMPTTRFALMPINKGGVVKTFPNSFGIVSGLKMRF